MAIHLRKNGKEVWCGLTKGQAAYLGEKWEVSGDVTKGTCPECFKKIPPPILNVAEPVDMTDREILDTMAPTYDAQELASMTEEEITNVILGTNIDTMTPNAYEPKAPLAHWQLAHLRMTRNGLLEEVKKLVKEIEKLEFTPEGKDIYWAMDYCKDQVKATLKNFRQDVRDAK